LAKEDGIKRAAILRTHIDRHMGMMSMWDKIKEHMENTLGTPLGILYMEAHGNRYPLQKRNRIGDPLAIHAKHMV